MADRFDLRRDIQLSTRVTAATFDDSSNRWEIRTDRGDTRDRALPRDAQSDACRRPSVPDIPGFDDFTGDVYFTAMWPREGVDFTGKRVGLIGTGSSGIQATPPIAAQADHLTVFQRTPNFSLPRATLRSWRRTKPRSRRTTTRSSPRRATSFAGFPYTPIERATMSVSDEEREEILEGLWGEGGFKFLWGGFHDLLRDPEANEIASEFIRDKIRETVKDPETAELLCPKGYPYGAKRPPIDTDYYETFNRDNVSLVDISEAPIDGDHADGPAHHRGRVRARRHRVRNRIRRHDRLAAAHRHPGRRWRAGSPTPGPTGPARCSASRSPASRTCSRSPDPEARRC